MAKCRFCGEELENGAAFCSNCGGKVEADANSDRSFSDEVNDKINEFTNTADTTSEYTTDDINSNKIMAVLSYLGILVLVPVFAAKNSPFARFHANQGIVLAISEIVINLVISVLSGFPAIGWLFTLIGGIADVAFLVFVIIGIINAVNGKAKELPVIGKIRILK